MAPPPPTIPPMRTFHVFLAILSLAGPAAADSDLEHFERYVRPVLVERCHSCHSGQGEVLQAGLRVDSLRALLEGGDSGPAIIPGDPANSLLVSAIRYESFEMPPRGKLSEKEVAAITKWIARGAKWPREAEPLPQRHVEPEFSVEQRSSEHWCWQRVRDPQPALDNDLRAAQNAIDHFHRKALAEA
ncbi:MAG: c-type cytochrome domain-containing protein, partial [Planctomycetota bacterium]